jgi:hypothetical protein
MPASIPREQAYYWTSRWQQDEQEALAEIARGQGRTFATTQEAIMWLLTEDD